MPLLGFEPQFLNHPTHSLVSRVTELCLLPFESVVPVKYTPGNLNVEDVSDVRTFTTSGIRTFTVVFTVL